VIDLRGIYIRRELEAGKFPLGTQQKHQPLDLHHAVERGGQGTTKNLMKAHLECQSTRSVPWAVKKASSQAEVGCKEHRATTVTLKSFFLLEEPKRRISGGYCRGIGPRSPLSMYIVGLKPNPRTRGRPTWDKYC